MNGERIYRRHLQISRTQGRLPLQVHISDEMKLLALIHRHEPLKLDDLQSLQPPKMQISYSANIETTAFNQDLNMLAVASLDGELCNVDLFSMRKIQRTEADVSHMAASSDGKTLIVGTKSGDIQIHASESLRLLHKIRHHEEEFMGLCFTSNSLRFLDIRRQFFNVWEPAALVRRIDNNPHTAPLVWPQPTTSLSEAASAKMAAHALREFANIAAHVDRFLGIHGAKLVFVSSDSWNCSMRIDKARLDDPIKYHLPMPHYWRNANRRRLGLVTSKGDIVVAIGGDLVIVKHCL
jgi:hypothetical protein